MSQLQSLNLNSNTFWEGTLNDILNCGNCTENLFEFIADSNKFSGSFPERLFDFSKLQQLKVASTKLTGTIPTGFGRLTTLEYLDLRNNNRLSKGTLPSEIGKLTNLKSLRLSGSTVEGTIPSEMQYLTNLEVLNIPNTGLSGSIAMEICNIDGLKITHSSRLNCSCPINNAQCTLS